MEADKLEALLPLSDSDVRTGAVSNNIRTSEKSVSKVKTIYLIDFENIGLEALIGIENLDPETERFCLFSTENAPKIPTATLVKILDIEGRNTGAFAIHEVPVKNQSVDMHLVSYLGYLIGVYGTSCNYVIRSSDTDYDNVVKYWKTREKVNIKRVGKLTTKPVAKAPIQALPSKKAPEKAKLKQPAPITIKPPVPPVTNRTEPSLSITSKQSTAPKLSTESKLPEPKQASVSPPPSPPNTELNNSILKAVVQVGYSTQEAGKVASVVCRESKKNKFPQSLHSELQKVFPGINIKNLYAAIKPIVSSYLESFSKENGLTTTPPSKPTQTAALESTPTTISEDLNKSSSEDVDLSKLKDDKVFEQLTKKLRDFCLEQYAEQIYVSALKNTSPDIFRNSLRTILPSDDSVSIAYRVSRPLLESSFGRVSDTNFYGAPSSEAKTRSLKNKISSILAEEKFSVSIIERAIEIAVRYYTYIDCRFMLKDSLFRNCGAKDGLKIYNLLKHLF